MRKLIYDDGTEINVGDGIARKAWDSLIDNEALAQNHGIQCPVELIPKEVFEIDTEGMRRLVFSKEKHPQRRTP